MSAEVVAVLDWDERGDRRMPPQSHVEISVVRHNGPSLTEAYDAMVEDQDGGSPLDVVHRDRRKIDSALTFSDSPNYLYTVFSTVCRSHQEVVRAGSPDIVDVGSVRLEM